LLNPCRWHLTFDLIAAGFEYGFGKHPEILGYELVLRQITVYQAGNGHGRSVFLQLLDIQY
jgi:hypothetical protein